MAEKKPKKLKKLIIQPRVKRTGPKPRKGKYDVILPKKTIKAPPAPSLVLIIISEILIPLEIY